MLNLKLSAPSDPRAAMLLEQNPSLSESLLHEVNHDLGRVATIIGPILDAPDRCEISSYYIHAVTTGRTAFLATNLPDGQVLHTTTVASSWLIGRDENCAVTVANAFVSRCHAVIGHCPDRGFYVMDLGSSNGTKVNFRSLAPQEPHWLQDGDLVELSCVCLEFFISGGSQRSRSLQDTQA